MAVASAGPYASLHLTPDTQPCQHPTTQLFTGRMPFLPLNQLRQSTEGTSTQEHLTTDEIKPTTVSRRMGSGVRLSEMKRAAQE